MNVFLVLFLQKKNDAFPNYFLEFTFYNRRKNQALPRMLPQSRTDWLQSAPYYHKMAF